VKWVFDGEGRKADGVRLYYNYVVLHCFMLLDLLTNSSKLELLGRPTNLAGLNCLRFFDNRGLYACLHFREGRW